VCYPGTSVCHGWGGDKNKFKRDQQAIIKRLDEISAMLADEKPDIAVLEEVDFDSLLTGRMNQAKYIAEKTGYSYRVEHKNVDARTLFSFSERFGNVLLSRYPVSKASLVSFPGHKKWETIMGGKSTAMLCDIEISSKNRIRVLATHLASFSEEVRVKSAKIIEKTRKASTLPFLVVGDLNSAPDGIPNHNLYKGENAMDILLAGGGFITLPLKDPAPSDFTISAGIVDWILVPPSWNITARRVPELMASDHFPVVMEMELPE
jgi:endonuclease/exonuclease/phosphatase family metal-dependent hydrolase